MDLQKELDKIQDSFEYMDEGHTWIAFIIDPLLEEVFDDDTYLSYAKDAAEAAKRVRYDIPYNEINDALFTEYTTLLKKYKFPEDEIPESQYVMYREFLNGRIAVFERISMSQGRPEEIPKMPEGDVDNYAMATVFANLPPQPEIEEYLKEINVNYDYDHLHMVTWFSAQTTHGSGHYSREEFNLSAKRTYNRLLNPYSLLWIAAALEEDPEVVRKAAADAEKVKTFAEKCGVVRKAIPFSRIYELGLKIAALEEEMLGDDAEEDE